MDLVVSVAAALAIGLPWAVWMLSQPTADTSGYLHSAPSRDLQTGSVREGGTSGAPLTGVPPSPILSVSPSTLWRTP